MANKYKVGDSLVWRGSGSEFYTPGRKYEVTAVTGPDGGDFTINYQLTDDKDNNHHWDAEGLDRLFERENSPVRTVTRTEIVPGEYGPVEVGYSGALRTDSPVPQVAHVRLDPTNAWEALTADRLREAARIFNELADALEPAP